MRQDEIQILLVDDDEDDFVHIRDLLSDIKGARYRIDWKPNYNQGLEALRNKTYHACLLDYQLGEHTGLDLLIEAQKINFSCPIIFLTGHGDLELDLKAMRVGASEYLVKGQLTAPLLERTIRYCTKHAADVEDAREREEIFRTLFNSTFEGVLVHKQGIIKDVNASAGEVFGCHPLEMIGQPVSKFIMLSDTPLGHASSGHLETTGYTKEGSEISIEVANRQVSLKGEVQSLTAIRDLTVRKRLEAQVLQQDRLASLGLLASSLAHEIGTPLGIIRSRAELTERRLAESSREKADMQVITAQIDRIAQLVNSLLNLARDKHSDHTSNVDVEKVLIDVLSLIRFEFDRNDIDFDLNIKCKAHVRAESGPLGQVLLNLLVNAIHAIQDAKASGRPSGHRITFSTIEDGDKYACITIADTGSGIPKENMNHLFKPFFTTKDIGRGTGLGLAISAKLVQDWGGTISVQSTEGEGSTFTLKFIKAS